MQPRPTRPFTKRSPQVQEAALWSSLPRTTVGRLTCIDMHSLVSRVLSLAIRGLLLLSRQVLWIYFILNTTVWSESKTSQILVH